MLDDAIDLLPQSRLVKLVGRYLDVTKLRPVEALDHAAQELALGSNPLRIGGRWRATCWRRFIGPIFDRSDRQEQEGRRLPALPLIEIKLG